MRKTIIIIFAFIMFATTVGAQNKDPQHIVKIGEKAPNFTMKYLNGKQIQLSDLKGKVVMLQFTASWCSVCLKEMPHIEKEIWQKHKNDTNFVLAGIDLKENAEQIKKFQKLAGISYPIILDEDGAVFEKYAEKEAGVTRNIIIGKDGNIKFLTRLFKQEEFDKMKEVINELLKK